MDYTDMLKKLPPGEREKFISSLSTQEQRFLYGQIDEEERIKCEQSLSYFVRKAWHTCESAEYIHNWHVDAISEHLEAVTAGKIKNLIINIPPRCAKSLCVSVFWPVWEWIRNPKQTFLVISYADKLCKDHSIKSRQVIRSDWFQKNWGDKFHILADQDTQTKYRNNKFGHRISSSVGGTATGLGGNRIIIDDPSDPMKSESEIQREEGNRWCDEVLSSRQDNARLGTKVVVMQRLHERDLTGLYLARNLKYDHLCLPMRYESAHPTISKTKLNFVDPRTNDGELLWPTRLDEEAVSRIEGEMGSYAVAGQYQQRPAPREGGMFERDWFKILNHLSAVDPVEKVCRHWDLAASEEKRSADPDYTVGLKLARTKSGRFVIMDMVRVRYSAHKVEELMRRKAYEDGRDCLVSIPVDPGQAGKAYAEYLVRQLAGYKVKAERESGNKETRAEPVAAQAESGNVYMIRGDWNEAFLNEVDSFPNSAHDDCVDSLSGAFARLITKRRIKDMLFPDMKTPSKWSMMLK